MLSSPLLLFLCFVFDARFTTKTESRRISLRQEREVFPALWVPYRPTHTWLNPERTSITENGSILVPPLLILWSERVVTGAVPEDNLVARIVAQVLCWS
jgi:hypothetical protein